MKLLILSDLGKKPTRQGLMHNNSRPSGIYHIAKIARDHDVNAEVIDYWREWPQDKLLEAILTWFSNEKDCWISLSGSIDGSSTEQFKDLVFKIKKHIPVKVMLGGYRVTVGQSDWVDIAFIGRCTNIFSKWLRNESIDEYLHSTNPPTYKNYDSIIHETPVCVLPLESDFWDKRETMTLELSLGCKFNCSFCGYDYRNNKNPKFINKQLLKDTLETAYNQFGITEFVLADDTINEVDTKITLLAEVVRELDFDPNFNAFVRLDVLGAQKHQLEILKEARINSMFFGIESFNPGVTKLIRKGGKPERNFDTLRLVRDEYPEAFTFGNFIVGLTGDDEKSIRRYAHQVADEQVLTSAGSNTLRLYASLDNKEIMSDIDMYPEKFGYEIIGTDREWPELGYSSQSWKNNWTNSTDADKLNFWLDKFYADNLNSAYTSHEVSSLRACQPGLEWPLYNKLLNSHNAQTQRMISTYIGKKYAFLLGK